MATRWPARRARRGRDQLAAASSDRLPMLSHAWVSSYLEHRNLGDAPWQCFLAYQDDELIGVLPLIAAREEEVRGRLRGPADSHTRSASPLLNGRRPVRPGRSGRCGVRAHTRVRLRWYRVRDDSPVLASLPSLKPRKRVLSPVSGRGSLVRTTGPRCDFEDTLHSNFRRNLRKAANRAARDHSVAFRFVGGAEAQDPALLRAVPARRELGLEG